MTRSWRLDDGHQTLVLAARGDFLPQVIYWSGSLPVDDITENLIEAHVQDVTGGMLDANPDMSICPEAHHTFPGQPGIRLRNAQGQSIHPCFKYVTAEEHLNQLSLTYSDAVLGLIYKAHFAMNLDTGLMSIWAELSSEMPVHMQWLAAPVLPAPHHSDEMLDFSGRWIGEFQMNRVPWTAGSHMRENRTGRTGHEHFPGLLIPETGATNTKGHVFGFHYGWSGGHKMIAEELPDGRRQVQFGHASDIQADVATSFQTAKLYAVFSDVGLNGCATAFQRHLRDHVVAFPTNAMPRPIHYNCWEAIYFKHNISILKEIAKKAADLGAERFVLDDGWFGSRNDDTTSLGDWQIDPHKYPEGLEPLVSHVNSLGMQFGLWFEPEMVNPDSALYHRHSDWVLGASDQLLGRHQMVLNLALPDVRDYLYDCIAQLLNDYNIDYIKWDHNRVLPLADAAQTHGTYELLDRLQATFPNVEIESCSSGGGRIDFGILERTQRVWLSDSNDALERSRIQHNAALFLPSVVTGSHIGPRSCHTSGRIFDIRYRAWVAAQRHMGFEMDPRELTNAEAEILIEVTNWYKDNRNWLAQADILRLDSSDPAVIAEMQLSRDGHKFVIFSNQADTSAQINRRPLRLTQLEPLARYKLILRDRDQVNHLSRSNPLLKTKPLEVSGTWLMLHGINLPWAFPGTIWVVEGEKI